MAVVDHLDAHGAVAAGRGDRDRAPAGVLHGVADQVRQHLLQTPAVPPHRRQVVVQGDLERVAAPSEHRAAHGLGVAQHGLQRQLLAGDVELAGLDVGQVEHIVDEGEQVAPRAQDAAEIRLVPFVEVLLEHLAVAEDGVQRRAELVAHRGEEGGLGAVRRLCVEQGLSLLLLGEVLGAQVPQGEDGAWLPAGVGDGGAANADRDATHAHRALRLAHAPVEELGERGADGVVAHELTSRLVRLVELVVGVEEEHRRRAVGEELGAEAVGALPRLEGLASP